MSIFELFGLSEEGGTVVEEPLFDPPREVAIVHDTPMRSRVLPSIEAALVQCQANNKTITVWAYPHNVFPRGDLQYRAVLPSTFMYSRDMNNITDKDFLRMLEVRLRKEDGSAFGFHILQVYPIDVIVSFLLASGVDIWSKLPSPIDDKPKLFPALKK